MMPSLGLNELKLKLHEVCLMKEMEHYKNNQKKKINHWIHLNVKDIKTNKLKIKK